MVSSPASPLPRLPAMVSVACSALSRGICLRVSAFSRRAIVADPACRSTVALFRRLAPRVLLSDWMNRRFYLWIFLGQDLTRVLYCICRFSCVCGRKEHSL
ncbi:hypothetical protein VPH35_036172 [Triticum aestivum]|uniref:Uncharacterized protein n=1 Tax=Aegilops tauschii subsp. strangulata TaxID=200361 RepID=A0A453B7L3_AEGTS